MQLHIGIIKGDGIGPEIVTEAVKVLDKVGETFRHTCDYTELLLGGASIDVHGVPLTDETVEKAKACDAVLMGPLEAMQRHLHGISLSLPRGRRRDFFVFVRNWACSRT